jgi:hypothetical protein
MGMFDARCMITGVSLKGSGAALVLLQQQKKVYHPIALAITGKYDRAGSIDMIREDDNTALVLRYFQNQLAAKAFVVDEEYLRICEAFPIETTEQLLHGFERTMHDHDTAAVLNGQPVVFALIATTVWNALARDTKKQATDDSALFRELFKAQPVAAQIYDGRLEDVSQHIRKLAAVSAFLTERTMKWKPAKNVNQHYSEEMKRYLRSARTKFKASAVVLDGLKAYWDEVTHLLDD